MVQIILYIRSNGGLWESWIVRHSDDIGQAARIRMINLLLITSYTSSKFRANLGVHTGRLTVQDSPILTTSVSRLTLVVCPWLVSIYRFVWDQIIDVRHTWWTVVIQPGTGLRLTESPSNNGVWRKVSSLWQVAKEDTDSPKMVLSWSRTKAQTTLLHSDILSQ